MSPQMTHWKSVNDHISKEFGGFTHVGQVAMGVIQWDKNGKSDPTFYSIVFLHSFNWHVFHLVSLQLS